MTNYILGVGFAFLSIKLKSGREKKKALAQYSAEIGNFVLFWINEFETDTDFDQTGPNSRLNILRGFVGLAH